MSKNQSLNIFIPAAGRGERLRPITDHIPKPLMPVLGKPVLQHVLERVSKLSFNKIGINLHYKSEALSKWIDQCPFNYKINLFNEENLLGTGGALKNAEELLKQGPFLVHNSDVLSNIDLGKFIEHHRKSNNLITLAVHDFNKFNSLVLDEKRCLVKVDSKSTGKLMAYTGVAVYESDFLKFLPDGTSSVVDAWLAALKEGCRIGTLDVSGCYWSDIGTADSYAASVFHALRHEGETVHVHPSVKGTGRVQPQGYLVIEKDCIIKKDVTLNNCITLPGSVIPRDDDNGQLLQDIHLLENCIIGPDFMISLDISEVFQLSGQDNRQLIGTGGSDRKYYRIRSYERSLVLMQSSANDPEFIRHMEYTKFFRNNHIPVPAIASSDTEQMKAVFEDAGDVSLYSYLKCNRTKEEIENIYKQVLDIAAGIHNINKEQVKECPLLENRLFDRDYFRWETDYFLSQFVYGIKNIEIKDAQALRNEFDMIAETADSFPKTVMHRDFQSQNIMVMKGSELRVIDFQGARIGPAAYDVASILWDPYFRLDDDIRSNLLKYYISVMHKYDGDNFSENGFASSLVFCRLQRHMQALGAYGFLSLVKGKKYFQKFIPEGIRLLKEDILLAGDNYPYLGRLVSRL
jgi:NDP-sugar pyrophosphorylase family protein